MKIKLISPQMSMRPMDSDFKRFMSMPLSLCLLKSLTPSEHFVYVEDENISPINFEDSPDLVGITVNVDTAHKAYRIADIYRKMGIPVVLGGIHPTVNPEECLNHADAICAGEVEYIWPELLKDLSAGRLKPIYRNNKVVDLTHSPIPDRSALPLGNYLYSNILYTSRGCPYRCEFCYNSADLSHNIYRNRPINSILEEIESLNSRHVMFIDDNFIGNPAWTNEFLDHIKPLELKWNAAVSSNIINTPDLIDKMKETGCQSLFIGFETMNTNNLKAMNKRQNNVDNYEKLINMLHERNIMINASLVFGFDEDRSIVFKETLDWLVTHKIETMTAHILTPYPGTVFYQKMLEQNRIIDFDQSHFNTSHVVFKPSGMTPEELYHGYLWIYDEFYSIKNILKRLPSNHNRRNSYLLFNLGYRKFGKITSKIARHTRMNAFGNLASRLSYQIK
jgi:radical SAM superfamily enzyme YgiQ (UPF0313 family)